MNTEAQKRAERVLVVCLKTTMSFASSFLTQSKFVETTLFRRPYRSRIAFED
jgi:hypothetical protein